MGITTQVSLTDEWVQVADAGQRVVLQRLTGSLYLRYAATQPDADNNEAFRLFDNAPLELSNDQPLWAKAERQGYLILVPVPPVTAGGGTGGATEVTLAAVDAKLGGTLSVNVVNQLDLTTITSHLLAIKDSAAALDANTDTVEQQLTIIVDAINSGATINHADLLSVASSLQAVEANTDDLETTLGAVLAKIIASPATLTEQQAQTTLLGGVYQAVLPDLIDNQKLPRLLDKKGRQLKAVSSGRVSYSASSTPRGITPALNALKDFWFIRGSATKKVYVKRITVSSYAGGRSVNSIGVKKRSAPNTGGTVTNLEMAPVDSTSIVSGARVGVYTATPTTEGTLVATVFSNRFLIPKNDDQVMAEKVFTFSEPFVLNNADEMLSLQCGLTIAATTLFFITAEWDEE